MNCFNEMDFLIFQLVGQSLEFAENCNARFRVVPEAGILHFRLYGLDVHDLGFFFGRELFHVANLVIG